MTLAKKYGAARAEVRELEDAASRLETNAAGQRAELELLRRQARAGTVEFSEVVTQQARADAAAGMYTQHLQDLADARAVLDELTAAMTAAELVSEGRAALERMRATEGLFTARAAAVETQLRADLADLQKLRREHEAARRDLRAAVGQAVRAAHPEADTARLYGQGRPYKPTPAHESAAAFLELVGVTEGEVVMVPTGSPHLQAAAWAHVGKLLGEGW